MEQETGRIADASLSEEQLRTLAKSVKAVIPRHSPDSQTVSGDNIIAINRTLTQLLATSASSSITATHRVAAWNALCTYIDHCASSELVGFQDLLWPNGYWERCLELYLSHSQKARPKSSKQLLTTLANAAKQSTHFESNTDGIRSRISSKLMGKIVDQNRSDGVKPFLQALAQFISKDVLTLQSLALATSASSRPGIYERSDVLQEASFLARFVLHWLSVGDYASTTTQLLVSILDQANRSSSKNSSSIWPSALCSALQGSSIDAEGLRSHVYPVLFARSQDGFVEFLEELQASKSDEVVESGLATSFDAYIAALQTAKDLGLLIEIRGALVLRETHKPVVTLSTIDSWTHAQDPTMRLGAFSLIINDRSVTAPFSTAALTLIKKCLPSFHADTDPWFRGEVFGLFQRLVDRTRAATAVLSRDRSKDCSPRQLQAHQDFVRWCLRFLQWELRPTASYQRHICALRCFVILVRSGLDPRVPTSALSRTAQSGTRWAIDHPLLDDGLERLLLDLLLDPFDDVRQSAASVLRLYTQGTYTASHSDPLTTALQRAEAAMLASGRADQADGVAHMYALASLRDTPEVSSVDDEASIADNKLLPLIGRLEGMLKTAKGSLAAAVGKYPLHGMLTSVRYVLALGSGEKVSDQLFARLLGCLHDVWLVVKPTLCNDAPEGYQAEDAEDTSDMSSKDTLSYCWRALKEASLLLGALLPSAQGRVPQVIPTSPILALSDLCFEQLAELRHRGAFSTVAQTWIACCTATRITAGDVALVAYYDRTLALLKNNVTINTRRSAGLPSLMCGILIADSSGVLVSRALTDLEIAAREPVDAKLAHEGSLPQVHALNCVKDALKNTRLGERSEQHVPTAMQLAADSLRSDAWAVRNCGLMLFRGVLDRLLGTNDSYIDDDAPDKSRQLSLERHPQLYNTVIALLEAPNRDTGTTARSSEGVFPALQLLQRARVPETKLEEVRNAVLLLTASPLWHVRDKAARTYASFVHSDEVVNQVYRLLSYHQPFTHQNALHGRLLSVKYVLAAANRSLQSHVMQGAGEHGDVPKALMEQLELVIGNNELYTTNKCPLTQAAYVDALQETLSRCRKYQPARNDNSDNATAGGTLQESVLALCLDLFDSNSTALKHPGAAALRHSLAKLYAEYLAWAPSSLLDVRTLRVGCAVLERTDSDALCTLLDSLNENCAASPLSPDASWWNFIYQINASILTSAANFRVKTAAQHGLLAALEHAPPQGQKSMTSTASNGSQAADALETGSNQLFADQHLQLQSSHFQNLQGAAEDDSKQQRQSLAQWVTACAAAVSEQGLYSREAAAHAVAQLQCWKQLRDRRDLDEIFMQLCLITYDLLNDDEEELRLEAADTACRILGLHEEGFQAHRMPLVACQKLVFFIVHRWNGRRQLAEIAFTRAFGRNGGGMISVAQQLADSSQDNTALFAEEKQNLYIDEAREVRLWSQVAMRLDAHAAPKRMVRELSHWVVQGLQAMEKKLRNEVDGPLGWTTKTEIFVLGLQLIYGVEMLLNLSARGGKLSTKPSELRSRLACLLAVSDRGGMNAMWKAEIHRILGDAARMQVSRVAELLQLMGGK
ncbi:hypothetical protein MBLNU230_g7981t1 [Neophaeotheca triangularis]